MNTSAPSTFAAELANLIAAHFGNAGPGPAIAQSLGVVTAPPMRLIDYFELHYLPAHELERSTDYFYRLKITKFGEWLGHEATLSDLNDDSLNRFLTHRMQTVKRETVRGEKSSLVSLWNAAVYDNLVYMPPRRLRKIKREHRLIIGWSPQEMARLLSAALNMRGRFKGKALFRASYWVAYVLTAYDTGLRLGDLERLKATDVARPGIVTVVQHKTRKLVETGISQLTWEAIQRTNPQDREFVFRIVQRCAFYDAFRKLITAAGLKGTGKYLRRTSGSMVESIAPGRGHEHLGHSDRAIFDRHYNVRELTRRDPILPPPIVPLLQNTDPMTIDVKSSKYLGVTRRGDKFAAQIRLHGKPKRTRHLGRFDDEIEAARAYDAAAMEIGNKRLNFPDILPAVRQAVL